jgi:hypothetical protein
MNGQRDRRSGRREPFLFVCSLRARTLLPIPAATQLGGNAHMSLHWTLKGVPELAARSHQERRLALRRFRASTLRSPVNRWTAGAWLGLVLGLWGGAFAASFLREIPGAGVLAMGGIGAFYLHHFLIINHMSRCISSGRFAV